MTKRAVNGGLAVVLTGLTLGFLVRHRCGLDEERALEDLVRFGLETRAFDVNRHRYLSRPVSCSRAMTSRVFGCSPAASSSKSAEAIDSSSKDTTPSRIPTIRGSSAGFPTVHLPGDAASVVLLEAELSAVERDDGDSREGRRRAADHRRLDRGKARRRSSFAKVARHGT